MPDSRYIKLMIGGQQADLYSTDDFPGTITYKNEDPLDFQRKKSSEAIAIKIPATIINDKIANTFHNPGIDDMTVGQEKRNFQRVLVEANGYELLVGKCVLTEAKHNSLPISYEFDCYGNNGDWIIALKEVPIYDFLKHITFIFDKDTIESSWAFDGTNESLPYVFAPVRYGEPMETMNDIQDFNMLPTYMRPAISVYWLLYWGFKSQGYRIAPGGFTDSNYFRRLVMPWTWGNFLYSEGTQVDNLDFLAKSSDDFWISGSDLTGFIDCHVDNESTNGAFDNNGVYEYDPVNFEMKWTYIPGLDYGLLDAGFHLQVSVQGEATSNSEVKLYARWFKNGVEVTPADTIVEVSAPAVTIGNKNFFELVDIDRTFQVEENDVISCKIYADIQDSSFGTARVQVNVDTFELAFLRIPLGGTINFDKFSSFKKHKWIDFLAGILDCFNISPETDPINKVVLLEPLHPYSLVFDQSTKTPGYLNGNHLDWNGKQDISKESTLTLFSDSERELFFRFKDDSNDGILKKVQDRNGIKVGAAKYVFSDRFKAGVKEFENRFFSPVMHYRPEQWGFIGNVPQMICMIPENVSNTSRDEAQNTFSPKLAWYKGIADMGWVWDSQESTTFPFMFAVNYTGNGAEDPILSYCDEFTVHPSDGLIPAPGLLRRFYLQRMAILRNGQYYQTHFTLNNLDVTNFYHREHIVCRGQKWELVEIDGYKPLIHESTKVLLRKSSPITAEDSNSIYPSKDSVATAVTPSNSFDSRYAPLRALASDIAG